MSKEDSDDRFLLYLDILGFSELVKEPDRVLDLYQIMDRLNLHRHHAFRAIIFSDTLLVYNIKPPRNDDDRRCYTMFLVEMAQDLLYRTIGRELYFRAIVTKGQFDHVKFTNLDAFYGPALVQSYNDESTLIGVGVFMHESVLPYNQIFPVERHCDCYHYVFVTQDLSRTLNIPAPQFPLPPELVESGNETYGILPQIEFLKDVWTKSRTHPHPKVQAKFQATWTFYEKELPGLCEVMARSGFDMKAISLANWAPAQELFESELKSDYFQFDPSKIKPFPDESH